MAHVKQYLNEMNERFLLLLAEHFWYTQFPSSTVYGNKRTSEIEKHLKIQTIRLRAPVIKSIDSA